MLGSGDMPLRKSLGHGLEIRVFTGALCAEGTHHIPAIQEEGTRHLADVGFDPVGTMALQHRTQPIFPHSKPHDLAELPFAEVKGAVETPLRITQEFDLG